MLDILKSRDLETTFLNLYITANQLLGKNITPLCIKVFETLDEIYREIISENKMDQYKRALDPSNDSVIISAEEAISLGIKREFLDFPPGVAYFYIREFNDIKLDLEQKIYDKFSRIGETGNRKMLWIFTRLEKAILLGMDGYANNYNY